VWSPSESITIQAGLGYPCQERPQRRHWNLLGGMQKKIIAKTKAGTTMKPLICINNIDFKQLVHTNSIKKKTCLFHGTWGYLHSIRPELPEKVDMANISLESYTEAIKASAERSVPPSTFFPKVFFPQYQSLAHRLSNEYDTLKQTGVIAMVSILLSSV
jgi:hypothetical protein